VHRHIVAASGRTKVERKVVTRHDGRILVIELANPPVNALAHEVRDAVLAALQAAQADAGTDAVVITGAGKLFCGGAEIKEFGQTPRAPHLAEIVNAIEESAKPVIAALNGSALGGGFEIALGCHVRLAVPGANVVLPEVKLGLLPGAGGTQRVPRLIGLRKALPFIVNGEAMSAAQALTLGLLDGVEDGDIVGHAIKRARHMVESNAPIRRTGRLRDALEASRRDAAAFEDDAAALLKKARSLEAPAACITALRNTLTLTLEEGLAAERALFVKLRDGGQSKALRHLFFAERAAQKVAGVPADTKPRSVGRVAILGAGTMGGGIAMAFASAGFPVSVIDPDTAALKRGFQTIENNYRASEKRGGMSAGAVAAALNRLTPSQSINDVASADLVIEAVYENMDLKKRIFADFDRLTTPGTVLATNTSSLDIDEIAAATSRPQDVVGMHFFSPANVMKLLEIVRGKATAPEVLVTAMNIGKRIGKVPVTVGVCYGFVGNRMLHARGSEVERLLLEGASPRDIDAAATRFGFAMGPCAVGDLAGLDVGWRIRKERGITSPVADAICEMGRFGQKTSRGYFIYEPGSRLPVPDPEVDALTAKLASDMGMARRSIAIEEIQERLLYPLINEGARILEEGIAERASDIDLIWINGYGFPLWRGGPLFYADTVGLGVIAERLDHYASLSGDKRLKPAKLLRSLAIAGKGFGDIAAAAKG